MNSAPVLVHLCLIQLSGVSHSIVILGTGAQLLGVTQTPILTSSPAPYHVDECPAVLVCLAVKRMKT